MIIIAIINKIYGYRITTFVKVLEVLILFNSKITPDKK
jgi:hypothetical protein